MTEKKTFEATYRSYPFPVLVDFGLALSRLFLRTRNRRRAEAEASRRTVQAH
jgi:hypothetical protein